MKGPWVAVIGVILISLGTAKVGQAFPTIFFGKDAGKDEFTRLLPDERVNANAAHADFLSLLIDPKTESFEGITVSSITLPPLSLEFGTGVSQADLTVPLALGAFGFVSEDTSGTDAIIGRYPTSGTKYFDVISAVDPPNEALSVAFTHPQAAFGFFATDIGDEIVPALPLPDFDLVLERFSGGSLSVDVDHFIDSGASGSALFWGIVDPDDPLTKVTFRNASSIDGFGIDDFTIAVNAVPEPSTLLLLGSALLVGAPLVWWRRRMAQ